MVLSLIPLNWHWRNKNIPAIALILWLVPYNLCTWINSFIWPTDISLFTGWEGGIYCDIQVKLLVAGYTGLMVSILAIARNLAKILSDDNPVVQTKAVQRRENIKDLVICLGIPIYMMAIHYVVQPRRYYLYTISGCVAVVDKSWPSIVIIFIWPPITALIASSYAGLSGHHLSHRTETQLTHRTAMVIYRLHKYRTRFTGILSNSTYSTKSRFMRLLILAVILLIIFLPLTIYMFINNAKQDHLPYDWAVVHGNGWLWVKKIPTGTQINFDRCPPVGVGFLVFLLFGIGKDAMVLYRDWLRNIGIGEFLPDWVMGREKPDARAFAVPVASQECTKPKRRADIELYAPLSSPFP